MSLSDSLRVAHIAPLSFANGPGRRVVVWLQGCSLRCAGCFNPQTHEGRGGLVFTSSALVERVYSYARQNSCEGVTFSGGEPFDQSRVLVDVAQRLRRVGLSVVAWSGYDFDELQQRVELEQLRAGFDVLICGRFVAERRIAREMQGSDNKTVELLSARYTLDDVARVPVAEVSIAPDGSVFATGVDPLLLQKGL